MEVVWNQILKSQVPTNKGRGVDTFLIFIYSFANLGVPFACAIVYNFPNMHISKYIFAQITCCLLWTFVRTLTFFVGWVQKESMSSCLKSADVIVHCFNLSGMCKIRLIHKYFHEIYFSSIPDDYESHLLTPQPFQMAVLLLGCFHDE